MIREFKLPDVGEGLTEAELVAWHVEPGDTVSEDQVVAEVETDKAVVEVPAPVDGTVKELRAEPGDLMKVGEVLITFEVDDDEAESAAAENPDPPTEFATEASDRSSSESPHDRESTAKGGRVFAAPSARRLARELGVTVETVEGSGPSGRVTEADVRRAAEQGSEPDADEPQVDEDEAEVETQTEPADPEKSTPVAETEAAVPSGTTVQGGGQTAPDRDRTLAAPATRQLAREMEVDLDRVPADEERDGEAFVTAEAVRSYAESAGPSAPERASPRARAPGEDRVDRVPYRGVRRSIGEQMERSAYTAPHVTHHDEVDVTALVETRSQLREHAAERGSNLTYVPFVVKAVVAALAEYPFLNAELDEDTEEILLKGYYNIGIATATDAGLMVPVVERAGEKTLLELADDIEELVGKARDRSIAREEMQGGTFTITNFGAIGGEYATPIINFPEVAILGLGAIKEKPRVVDGEVVPRKVLTLSLSIDHRVVDGAVAAQFVNAIKERLADPDLLLLE